MEQLIFTAFCVSILPDKAGSKIMPQFQSWARSISGKLGDWADALAAVGQPAVEFFLHSLERELRFCNIDQTEFRQLLARFSTFLKNRASAPPRQVFAEFVKEALTDSSGIQCLVGRYAGIDSDSTTGLRVMKANTLRKMLGAQRRAAPRHDGPTRHRLKHGVAQRSHTVQSLSLERILEGDMPCSEISELGVSVCGLRGFFWFTPMDPGEPIQQEALAGTSLSNLLARIGIIPVMHNYVFLYFSYGGGSRQDGPRAPSVFEAGGGHKYFRPAWRADCWGEAVDLSQLARGEIEAVKPATPWAGSFPAPFCAGKPAAQKGELSESEFRQLLAQSETAVARFKPSKRAC